MANYSVIVDEVSSTVSYVGRAVPGSLVSEAVWQIRKIETIGSVTTALFADGSFYFDQVWDDRLSLSYSL